MNIAEAVAVLNTQVPNPSLGLPDDLFYYVTTVTPMINVDLLVKDEKKRTLLSWRDDQYTGKGWHLPGGIIRFKETIETRIKKVAEVELKTSVEYDPKPIGVYEIFNKKRNIRGHFISLLYKCTLSSSFVPKNKGLQITDRGFLKWHEKCPDDLLVYHEIFRGYI